MGGESRFDGDALCADVDGLAANTEYSVRVQACTSQGCGSSAPTQAVTRCAAPKQVVPAVLQPAARSIFVAWSPPAKANCEDTRYRLRYLPTGSLEEPIIVFTDRARNATISGLLPHREYSFQVEAINDVGATTGVFLATATLEAAPEAVAAPSLERKTDTEVFVSWAVPDSPNGVIVKYFVVLNGVDIVETTGTLHLARGLLPDTEYSFVLRACTAAGCTTGPAAIISTPTRPPAGLLAPSVSDVTGRAFRVTWAAPSQPNGIITGFTVNVRACTPGVLCSGPPTLRLDAAADARSAIIEQGVLPFTVYEVQVVATNKAGATSSVWTRSFSDNGVVTLLRTRAVGE